MAIEDRYEEYFWERYQTLVRTEENSSLYDVLTGVGPIETFSDVRTVLKMYDNAAEKVKSNYWGSRFNESVRIQKGLGLADKINISVYPNKEGALPKYFPYYSAVLFMEADLAGETTDTTNHLLNGGKI